MTELVEAILESMSNVKKPQKRFMCALFAVLMVFQGKATFRNLSRYSSMSEKCFSRWYRRDFDFAQFNTALLIAEVSEQTHRIAAVDASFLSKSRSKAEGMGWFYNGSAGKAQRGLEISLLSIVDLSLNTAYALDARQTVDEDEKTRVDLYAEHVVSKASSLSKLGVKYIAADAYYSKVKFVSAVTQAGFELVEKLRVDANMKWLYQGPYSGLGRPKKFDGKVNIDTDLARFEGVESEMEGVEVYTAVVRSKHLNCKIKVVLLRWSKEEKIGTALLYSTDTQLDATTLIRYYKARFQIEFLFRDAKQHTGLTHCQSRRKEATHTQVNASLSTLNLLKLEDRKEKNADTEAVISIATWKRKKFNQHLMIRLFDKLGLSLKSEKVSQVFTRMESYGAIAA